MKPRLARLLRGGLACLALAWPLLPCGAYAQWHDRQGAPLTDSADRAHDKGFGASLQIADDAEFVRFAQDWVQTGPGHAPQLRTITSVRRGQAVRVALLYAGCAPSPNNGGACDAQVSLRLLAPDGSESLREPMRPLGTGAPPAAAGLLELAPLSVQLRFDDSDPLGTYRVQATVNDPSQDAWVRLHTEIALVADE